MSASSSSETGAIIAVIVCLICAGLASGLTQGLLSLDHLQLEILKRSGTDVQKKQAAVLLPIIENHHWLLVTLMLWNAAAMETLPIFLDELVPTVVAIVMSVTLILLVGEIVPASIMTGPHQLYIVSNLQYLTWTVLFVFSPIAYPLSKLLDYVLGVDEKIRPFNRRQLAEMIKIQHEVIQENAKLHDGSEGDHNVNQQEVTMIDGVLKYKDIFVTEIMTTEVFMLSISEKLSFHTLNRIFKSGYSRIPIYDRDPNDVIGVILTKDLLFIDPEDDVPIKSFTDLFCRPIQSVWPDQKLGDVLLLFRHSKGHMAVVRDVESSGNLDPRYKVLGIVTLEDVFETMLGNEIMDETDSIDENNQVVKDRNRDVELMRMAILNPSLRGLDKRLVLSEEEIKVITSHFQANVPQMIELVGRDKQNVEELVRKSTLFEVKRVGNGDSVLHPENALYKRGKVSNSTILVLSGKLIVYAGRDGFKAEAGPWVTLAPDALLMRNDEYVSDFSAYIESPELRYLLVAKSLDEQPGILPPRHASVKAANTGLPVLNNGNSNEDILRKSRDLISFKPNATKVLKSTMDVWRAEANAKTSVLGVSRTNSDSKEYRALQYRIPLSDDNIVSDPNEINLPV